MTAWKTINEVIECKKCKGLEFNKHIYEKVGIRDIKNYNRAGKSLGGMWNETEIEEPKVTYTCAKCGEELK